MKSLEDFINEKLEITKDSKIKSISNNEDLYTKISQYIDSLGNQFDIEITSYTDNDPFIRLTTKDYNIPEKTIDRFENKLKSLDLKCVDYVSDIIGSSYLNISIYFNKLYKEYNNDLNNAYYETIEYIKLFEELIKKYKR